MDLHLTQVAQTCLDGAEHNTMTFPQIIGTLSQAGFEGYAVDFRRASTTYYQSNGDAVVLPTHLSGTVVADVWDPVVVQAAIKEAQQLIPGYTYAGFCAKVTAAGCAGYMVSFTGRRAVYYGRTAETHVEQFPQQKS
jgi:uncharacterized protein YbcV (DUF1398 family)